MSEDWRKRAIRWLEENNAAQQIWAINYLDKKDWFNRDRYLGESNYDYLVAHIRYASELLKFEDDLRKMKRAWSQKMKRDRKGQRKSYSFMMSNSVGPQLRYLAGKRGEPVYRTLELIISEHQEEVKSGAWLDMSRKKLEKRMEKVEQELKDVENKRKELDLREAEVQRQLAELESRAKDRERLDDEVLEYNVALDNKRDLIAELVADYTSVIQAHVLNEWIIGRKASLPPAPLYYQGRSKASHLLRRYQDLLASLER